MRKVIYGKETKGGEPGESLVAFDDTDHIDFVCSDCAIGLAAQSIELNDAEAEDADTILCLYFKCPKCNKVSTRKFRVNDTSPRRYLAMYTIRDSSIVNLGSLHYRK